MTLFRPLPRTLTRPVSVLVVGAWVIVMALLVHRSYIQASGTLATDLASYGTGASWRGIYYRGEKIGFTVSQTVPVDDGFELQEDGRLQMSLLGAASPATLRTRARVDRDFALQSFVFSLDPGTGAVSIGGRVEAGVEGRLRLLLDVTSTSGTRSEVRDLAERPVLSQNLSRLLATGRLVAGTTHRLAVFDPATLRDAPVTVAVGDREIVRAAERPVPAFRVSMEYQGLRTTSWVTDTGEIIREESPLGLISVQETPERAQQLAVSGRIQADMLASSAVVPTMTQRIDNPRDVRRISLKMSGVDLSTFDLDGIGQELTGDTLAIWDTRQRKTTTGDSTARQFLAAEPLIESDAPEIRAEALKAVADAPASNPRLRVERLTRHVNAILEKKPTVSLPSAREVLRTRVGDCNEHTALYVAMARAIDIPARINVGLVFMHGAFYYHAWPEVFIDEAGGGYWLPVDPTLNEFPANATHVRLLRGGLERQAAILPLIGQLKITVTDLELAPESVPILIGQADLGTLPVAPPAAAQTGCRCDRSSTSTLQGTSQR